MGDESPLSRLPEFHRDILARASDVYHHDGDDARKAIRMMEECELPVNYQASF